MNTTCEMPLQNATSDEIRNILLTFRTIAVGGLSDDPERSSYQVPAGCNQRDLAKLAK